MKSNMLEFAEHILSLTYENGKYITNLHLQLVMYFSLRFAKEDNLYADDYLRELYSEPFYVCQFGPRCENVYRQFKYSGSEVILAWPYENKRNDEKFGKMNKTIMNLVEINPFYLVGVSHKIPFWIENKKNMERKPKYSLEQL